MCNSVKALINSNIKILIAQMTEWKFKRKYKY